MRNMSPQLGKGEEWNTPEQSNSEDSSLSDSDKTLVGDTRKECVYDVPYLLLRTTLIVIFIVSSLCLKKIERKKDRKAEKRTEPYVIILVLYQRMYVHPKKT